MKKLTVILAMIICQNIFCQMSFYVPLHTSHYVHLEDIPYIKGEGGNIGLVGTYNFKSLHISTGIVRNSYGKRSFMLGLGSHGKIFNNYFGVTIGLMDGYRCAYFKKYNNYGGYYSLGIADSLPNMFVSNGIMPYASFSYMVPIYKNFGVQINITPSFINSGIYFNL